MRPRNRYLLAVLALLVVALPDPAAGQLGGLRRRAEAAALEKTKSDSARQAAARDSVAKADSATARQAGGTPAAPSPQVWDNYDFVPGSKLLFYTDFSEDRVGNFARGLKYTAGSMDVVERDGVKMLRSTSRGEFMIPVGGRLPERFTLEIDVISPAGGSSGYDNLAFEGGAVMDRNASSAEINWAHSGTVIIGGGQNVGTSNVTFPEALSAQNRGHVAHVRMLVDGPYVKVYNNERRIYNIPELGFKRDSVIRVSLKGAEQPGSESYITMIRLAESEVDMLYDALTARGRWVTQGILFEVGKADLKPESRPVLKEIAATLQKYPELKILIEGHTDNTGTAAGNLTLSDARAASVKAALVADFAIAADRITTRGMGDTQPAAPNTTATGRAQNRRVEVVKQ